MFCDLRERPVAAEEFGAEELAMDANKVGPDEPRREAVVVGAVDVAVKPRTEKAKTHINISFSEASTHTQNEQSREWDLLTHLFSIHLHQRFSNCGS